MNNTLWPKNYDSEINVPPPLQQPGFAVVSDILAVDEVKYLENGYVSINIVLPISLLESVKNIIEGLVNLGVYQGRKARQRQIIERSRTEEYRQKMKDEYSLFEDHALSLYRDYLESSVPAAAFKKVQSKLKTEGRHVDLYTLKLVINKGNKKACGT